jgi:hypothetical protein
MSPLCRPDRIRALLLLVLMLAAPLAQAQDLRSFSASYQVQLAPDADKLLYAEGQGSFSLSKSCQGWTLGEVFQFGIEKGAAAAPKQLGQTGDRIEERLTTKESADGGKLTYQTRLRLNARVTTASGKATLGSASGRLSADLGTYTQTADLPAGTLAPAAARAFLLEALLANRPDPIEVHTVELMRFHKPVVQRFHRLPPGDTRIATALPKDLRSSDKEFGQGRTWALLRRVGNFNEFGDEFWLLHESGAIVRQVLTRQTTKLVLEAREVTFFPPPSCP